MHLPQPDSVLFGPDFEIRVHFHTPSVLLGLQALSGFAPFRRPRNYRSPGAGILKIKRPVVQELGLQYDGNFSFIRFGRIGGANKPVLCLPFVCFPGTPAVRNPVRKSEVQKPSSPLVAILADMLKSALDWETSKECASSDGG